MTPTEKHRETASELATRIAGGVLNNDDAAYVERYGSRWIEEALAKAEREGMKRAAEIAFEQHKLWVNVVDSRMECGMDATVQAAAATEAEFIADAILSEIGKDE